MGVGFGSLPGESVCFVQWCRVFNVVEDVSVVSDFVSETFASIIFHRMDPLQSFLTTTSCELPPLSLSASMTWLL